MHHTMYVFISMAIIGLWLNVFAVDSLSSNSAAFGDEVEALVNELKKARKNTETMAKQIGVLSRQIMLQQLAIEERVRSEGQSGIKQIRDHYSGSKSYFARSHTGRAIASIHDHSNNIRTVGMGEFIAVLNGVEFRTRHNDYRLYMPSKTSHDYGAVQDIPFPQVPPQVTALHDVTDQVNEMVEWFKAWKNQDHSVRDYRQYFKPVLCYLEGTWTKSTSKIDEPFESDRHFVDADSWFDLQEKIRFTSYTGRKDALENFAYLPTSILKVVNETMAVFAQWNYRILCHPLKKDVPLNRFRMVDDIAIRLTRKQTMEEMATSRAARFQVNVQDSDKWRDRTIAFSFLDELMGEIPGMDNYEASITDDAFGQVAYTLDPAKSGQELNAAYYHRGYKVMKKGAMGIQTRSRGFSDPTVYMAMNTQDKVAGINIEHCKKVNRKKVCQEYSQKFSFAIPLEIIYMTPLNSWNPYNLQYKDTPKRVAPTSDGGNGDKTPDKPYDGIHSTLYYITPHEFFSGTGPNKDPADTARSSVGVLDAQKNVRTVRAAGTRIFFPNIPGVGTLRQRFPIMPVHAEGSSTWKKLEAVQDMLMDSKTHARLYRQSLGNAGGTTPEVNTDVNLMTYPSRINSSIITPHRHELTLTSEQQELLSQGKEVIVTTSRAANHEHDVVVGWNARTSQFYIDKCDGKTYKKRFGLKCWDKHSATLIVKTTLP